VSAGLYLYSIQAGEFRQTKKMVLLKWIIFLNHFSNLNLANDGGRSGWKKHPHSDIIFYIILIIDSSQHNGSVNSFI
jgi:hypothetical protein